VIGRQRREKRLAQDADRLELAADRRAQKGSVNPVRGERFDLLGRHHLLQDEIDAREALARPSDQLRQEAIAGGGRKADRHRSRIARSRPPGGQGRALCQVQNAPCLRQERATGGRESDDAARTLQELHAKDPFQDLDLPAERRLRHVEPLGGTAEMQLFRGGDEAT
jgi:hypothetical protein